jgi:hypothetical protein
MSPQNCLYWLLDQIYNKWLSTSVSILHKNILRSLRHIYGGFGGLEVACWSLVPKFAGSHLAESVGILGQKNPQHAFFGEEVKPSVPCRSFTACKRSLNVMCKSVFRQNYRTFIANSSTFRRWVFSRGDTRGDAWWQKLERLTKIAQLALKAAVRSWKTTIIIRHIHGLSVK